MHLQKIYPWSLRRWALKSLSVKQMTAKYPLPEACLSTVSLHLFSLTLTCLRKSQSSVCFLLHYPYKSLSLQDWESSDSAVTSNILATPGSNVCCPLDVSSAGMAIIIRRVQRRITVLSYRYVATTSRSYRGCSCALQEQHSILQVPDCQSLASEIVMPKGSYTLFKVTW